MASMADVMAPTTREIEEELKMGLNHHRPCLRRIARAETDRIPIASIPEHTLLWRVGSNIGSVIVTTLQIAHITSMERSNYTINPAWRPPPIQIGVVWSKPHISLIPITGLTPEGWEHCFPPFHWNGPHYRVCVGDAFPIGTSETLQDVVPRLVELLSWVNLPSSYTPLLDAALHYHWQAHLISAWARALIGIQSEYSELRNEARRILTPTGITL